MKRLNMSGQRGNKDCERKRLREGNVFYELSFRREKALTSTFAAKYCAESHVIKFLEQMKAGMLNFPGVESFAGLWVEPVIRVFEFATLCVASWTFRPGCFHNVLSTSQTGSRDPHLSLIPSTMDRIAGKVTQQTVRTARNMTCPFECLASLSFSW